MLKDRLHHSALPLGILLVLTIVSFWLKAVVDQPKHVSSGKLRHDPDLIMTQFVAHRLGATGKLEQTLRAAEMRHFGDNDVSEYDKVTLSSFEPKKPNLVVTADHAERLKNNETIFLSGHVGVTQESSAHDSEPWIMSTERLEIYPNLKQGQSKEPVTVTHGKDRLEAVTMRFDYNLSTVKFERAHTLYAPHHR